MDLHTSTCRDINNLFNFTNTLFTMTLKEHVKVNLARKSMTQEDLAKELELTPMTISRRMATNNWRKPEISHMKHVLKFDFDEK